jgi:hypothetical protein
MAIPGACAIGLVLLTAASSAPLDGPSSELIQLSPHTSIEAIERLDISQLLNSFRLTTATRSPGG